MKSPAVLAAHAEALSRLGRRDEAEEAFGEVIRTCPNDASLLVARGFARLGHDQGGAAADFHRALVLDPRNARAHLGRAHLARTRDLRAALVGDWKRPWTPIPSWQTPFSSVP